MAALFRGPCGVWAAQGSFMISPVFAVCGEGLAVSAATPFIASSLQAPLLLLEMQPHRTWPWPSANFLPSVGHSTQAPAFRCCKLETLASPSCKTGRWLCLACIITVGASCRGIWAHGIPATLFIHRRPPSMPASPRCLSALRLSLSPSVVGGVS